MLALVACSANFITRLSLCWGVPRDFSHLKQMLFKFFFPRSLHISLLFPIPWWVSKLFKKFLLSSGVLHERGSADQLIAPSLPPSSQKYCCGFFLPWWGKSELARPEEAHLGRALPGARLLHSAALGPGPATARRTSTHTHPPPPRPAAALRWGVTAAPPVGLRRGIGDPARPQVSYAFAVKHERRSAKPRQRWAARRPAGAASTSLRRGSGAGAFWKMGNAARGGCCPKAVLAARGADSCGGKLGASLSAFLGRLVQRRALGGIHFERSGRCGVPSATAWSTFPRWTPCVEE